MLRYVIEAVVHVDSGAILSDVSPGETTEISTGVNNL